MKPSDAEALIDALRARRGLVAVVGAGGKKTTLRRLIEAHQAIGTARIALTATTKIAKAASSHALQPLIGDHEDLLAAVRSDRNTSTALILAAPSAPADRLGGLTPGLVHQLHAEGRFDVTLVKADGARMRLIKAPSEREPVLPPGTATVLPVVSAKVLDKPLSDRIAHRLERLCTIIGAPIGTTLQPRHLARLLTSDRGALQQVGDADVVPIINMVDRPEHLRLAREAATTALAMTTRYDRIVLASMSAPMPLIDIITRR